MKERKVCILEFEKNHVDYILAVYKNLRVKGYEKINIFIDKNIYNDFIHEIDKVDFKIEVENIITFNRKDIISMYYKIIIQKFDVIYFNTFCIKDIFFWHILLLFSSTKIVPTIHNARTNFIYQFTSIKSIISSLGRFFMNKTSYKFVVLNSQIKDYMLRYTTKEIDVIPFKIPITKTNCSKNKIIKKITIPGTINSKRRNYHQLIKTINKILSCRKDLLFIFLGRIVSEELYNDFETVKNNYPNNIIWFDYYVDQNQYNNYMIECDYILAPLKDKVKIGDWQVEYYGRTKASGAEFDAYKYNKKIIIPAFYKIKNSSINVFYYEDYNDLTKLLLRL